MTRAAISLLILAIAANVVVAGPAHARIQDDMVCWVPDCEFPVDCDEEE